MKALLPHLKDSLALLSISMLYFFTIHSISKSLGAQQLDTQSWSIFTGTSG